MNEDEKDGEKDQELASWLRRWAAPRAPDRLDQRVKAAYRSTVPRTTPWKRLREARISLPLPLALLVAGLVLGVGVLAGSLLSRGGPVGGRGERSEVARGGGLENLRPLPEVRLTVLKQGGEPHDQP